MYLLGYALKKKRGNNEKKYEKVCNIRELLFNFVMLLIVGLSENP